ncbi:MAG: siroheme synthase CysG [Gammaproteobacteria bacterium]|nr:siroheme synthase CysG [Gammaproteobacteria bacterium]MCY4227822.1 siroheme synthase CysG [Gammaproteobacteria bacterium]
MKHLPLMVNVSDRRFLIVGGGNIATRRARVINQAGALIDVVAKSATEEIKNIAIQRGGNYIERAWIAKDITEDYAFVIAATDDHSLNQEIREACLAMNIPVNVITDASSSDFTFPSAIYRSPMTIAVSSGSASPLLARLLAERIDALIPVSYGRLAGMVGKYRHKVRESLMKPDDRKRFWGKVLRGAVAEHVFSGNYEDAEALLESYLGKPEHDVGVGEVYLIGAGPGDPDLLTFRAYRLLQQSQVVLYDRLVSKPILDMVSPEATMIHVGKRRSHHAVPQTGINEMLVEYAQKGLRVARLKGGDPFIFGRGGEEIEKLAEQCIPFQIVPGITAASGCASYSGIPLTHRDHAQSVRFATGHLRDGTVNLPWGQLSEEDQTVVIYMGLSGLPIISEQLIRHGMSPDMPASLIERGTTPDQRIHCSTISNLPALVEQASVKPPTLLIIGTVVELHQKLRWFREDVDIEDSQLAAT